MIPMARPLVANSGSNGMVAVLRPGSLDEGHVVQQLEKRFAASCRVKHAVATSSPTTALQLALLAHGIGPGDEVISPSLSFLASARLVLAVGATPVFADIDPATLTIDPDDVEARITSGTRAVIAAHLYGTPADLDRLTGICRRHNLALIEDAGQAYGATWNGRPVGSFGAGCFSLSPSENVPAAGGGVLTTNDAEVAERARLLRARGLGAINDQLIPWDDGRMTDTQAVTGLAQLDQQPAWIEDRVRNAGTLRRLLELLPVEPQATHPGASHVYQQFTFRVRAGRDAVATYLVAHGVACEISDPIPIHRQAPFRALGYDVQLPHTERAAAEGLSLPVHPSLSGAELEMIARTLAAALANVPRTTQAAD